MRITGSDRPEKPVVRVGFLPLTDCASLLMAAVGQFDLKHGIRIIPSLEPSWATLRDKLLTGKLDAVHALYGLVYGIELGVGGPQHPMAVLMTLNWNGQAVTLSREFSRAGVTNGEALAAHLKRRPGKPVFAQTFPTGTHALWLNYWLAAHGIDPLRQVNVTTVPPPEMVSRMATGHIDGFCAGEPWNAIAARDQVGFTAATSQTIWPDHPEKALACTAPWANSHHQTARALISSILEASRWIEASRENQRVAAGILADMVFLPANPELLSERLQGNYDDGLGRQWRDAHPLTFFGDGEVNFPYLSDGMWFMTQHKRWGLIGEHPDYLQVASNVQRIDLYREGAQAAGVALPVSSFRSSRLMDGSLWNGTNPRAYAEKFSIQEA
ncbi:MAG: ABC transporter substrate-binding protein [Betaproteobacteria bacterium]|nr:ABC transporter substrate-binding protein [Betaproteobacteria bacterium]MDE2622464.1 ABC transporter substrate-binding protein [Betaproteobacteria bacterium]